MSVNRMKRRRYLTAYGFMSPWFIGFLCFSAYPIIALFVLSFTSRSLLGQSEFIGLQNYIKMFSSPVFLNSLKVTIFFSVIMMIVTTIWALFLAMLLNRKQRFNGIFQFCYFIPAVVPIVALAYAFRMILGSDAGILNYIISTVTNFNVNINWLYDQNYVYYAVFFVTLFTYSTGQMMLIFRSGLNEVPKELYEACDIDGAGTIRKFFNITLPMISPIILFNTVMGGLSALNGSFSILYPLTEGNPAGMTNVLSLLIYKEAFLNFKVGYGCAISVMLFFIACILGIVLFRLSKKFVYYEI